MKSFSLSIIFIFLITSCTQDNKELCKIIEGPIALDFRLGMNREEYYKHRDSLIEAKKLIPTKNIDNYEGVDLQENYNKQNLDDCDLFYFYHHYNLNGSVLRDKVEIYITPYFSNITNRLMVLRLRPRIYESGRTKFISLTSLIKVYESKYGGSSKFRISSKGSNYEKHYYHKEWICNGIEISFLAEVDFGLWKVGSKEDDFNTDINAILESQKAIENLSFPGYTSENSIVYSDKRAIEEIFNKRESEQDKALKKTKIAVDEKNKNEGQDF